MTTSPSLADSPPTPRRYGLLALKIAITLGAFAFLLVRQPMADLLAALRDLSLPAVAAAIVLQLLALAVGTLRWSVLMMAYRAEHVPTFGQLLRVYVVGHFYNTYLPGAVGGDVLRGVVTRKSFGVQGATSAVAVVFVERALGLAGVMGLTAVSTALWSRGRFGNVLPYALLGMVGVAVAVIGLALGRRLARFFPGPIARILERLPALARVTPFVIAVALSLVTQSIVALCGYVLVSSVLPGAPLSDSFLAMPLAGAAGYFPLTVAGAGARDLALVALYEALGVPRAACVATAFAFLFATLFTAGLGGIVQLLAPLSLPERADT